MSSTEMMAEFVQAACERYLAAREQRIAKESEEAIGTILKQKTIFGKLKYKTREEAAKEFYRGVWVDWIVSSGHSVTKKIDNLLLLCKLSTTGIVNIGSDDVALIDKWSRDANNNP